MLFVIQRHIIRGPSWSWSYGSWVYNYLCTYAISAYFVLFVFVLCTVCCQFLWIVHFGSPLRYSLTFIIYPGKQASNIQYILLLLHKIFSHIKQWPWTLRSFIPIMIVELLEFDLDIPMAFLYNKTSSGH